MSSKASDHLRPKSLLFAIGAQKAGTTWLYRNLLDSHSVHFKENETHYWDVVRQPFSDWDRQGRGTLSVKQKLMAHSFRLSGITSAAIAEYVRRCRYRGMFSDDPYDHGAYLAYLSTGYDGQPVIGDSTPSYALCSRETYAEMASLHPDTKFIFIMRDPVARMWSGVHHRFRFRLRADDSADYLLRAFSDALADPFHHDRRRSDYATTLRNLFGAVRREQVLCLFFEDLFQQKTLDRVTDFLDVPRIAINEEVVNPGVRPNTPLGDALIERALDVFSETYAYCLDSFDDLPRHAWMTPAQGAAHAHG